MSWRGAPHPLYHIEPIDKLLKRARAHERHAAAILAVGDLTDDERALAGLDMELAALCRRMASELDGCDFY